MAHPIELKMDDDTLRLYIKKLISFGLRGIEVYQSKHSRDYTNMLLDIVNEYNLLYSVGSDYHGPVITKDIELGYGKNNNLIKNEASILNEILG